MKNLKKILTAAAFSVAIAGAYATNMLVLSAEGTISTPQGNVCVAATVGDTCNQHNGIICTFSTVYQGTTYTSIPAKVPNATPCTGAFRHRIP